ncbi:MAG TPA: YheU family protein [Myxococcota bacterium]
MQIPHTSLQPATLQALIEEFVTRDGTDYGDVETSLQQRVDSVVAALRSKRAVIMYDDDSESCSIVMVR